MFPAAIFADATSLHYVIRMMTAETANTNTTDNIALPRSLVNYYQFTAIYREYIRYILDYIY